MGVARVFHGCCKSVYGYLRSVSCLKNVWWMSEECIRGIFQWFYPVCFKGVLRVFWGRMFKGRVWYKYKYILKDGRTYPETAAIFFFYEKFVVLVRQQLRPALIFSVIPPHVSLQTHHTQLCGHAAVLSVNPPHNSAATQSVEGWQRGQQRVRTPGWLHSSFMGRRGDIWKFISFTTFVLALSVVECKQ